MFQRKLKQLAATLAVAGLIAPAVVMAQGSTGGSGGSSSPSGGSASTGTSVPGGAASNATTGTNADSTSGGMTGMSGQNAPAISNRGTDGSRAMSGSNAGMRDGDMKAADKRFVMQAAMSDVLEIESSRMALQKSQNAEVKQYAQRMIDDHTKTTEQLKRIVADKGVTLPASPDRATQAKLDRLAKLDGEKFDREYMKLQRQNHAKAERLMEKRARMDSGDAQLQQFAQQTTGPIKDHHMMAKDHSTGNSMARGSGERSGSFAGSSGGASTSGTDGSRTQRSGDGAGSGSMNSGSSGSMNSGSGSGTGTNRSGAITGNNPPANGSPTTNR